MSMSFPGKGKLSTEKRDYIRNKALMYMQPPSPADAPYAAPKPDSLKGLQHTEF